MLLAVLTFFPRLPNGNIMTNQFRKLFTSLAGIVLALLVTASHVVPAHADEPETIRIGFAGTGVGGRPFYGATTFAVVHTQGLLEKEFANSNTKIEYKFYAGAGPAVNEALANGQIDFAIIGDLPSVMGRVAGLKTKLLMTETARSNAYIAVNPSSGIVSVPDLKGKLIATFKGTASQLAFNRILSEQGLSERDLRLVNLEPANAMTALAVKQIDGIAGTLYTFALEDRGIAKIIYTSKGQSPSFNSVLGLVVTDDFATRYPDAVNRVVRTGVSAAHWASLPENRQAVLETWAESGLPLKYFEKDSESDNLAFRNSPLLDPFVIGRYKATVSDAVQYRLTRGTADIDAWIDAKPLQAALTSLGFQDFWVPFDFEGKPIAKKQAAAQ